MSQWKRRGGSFSTRITRRQTLVIPGNCHRGQCGDQICNLSNVSTFPIIQRITLFHNCFHSERRTMTCSPEYLTLDIMHKSFSYLKHVDFFYLFFFKVVSNRLILFVFRV
uniref:Ovule protein n=1 Tax=Heterorhabditis bacteriophora TaxID=37862 RepID=A0A1I7WBQ4_HETBA